MSLNGGTGDDYVYNRGSDLSIVVGAGNDSVENLAGGSNVTVDGGSGKDLITNYAYHVTVNGGEGSDTIDNHAALDAVVNGGDGNDLIINRNWSSGVTIDGGKGDDRISLAGGIEVVNHEAGDGIDTIFGYNDKTVLNFDYVFKWQQFNDIILQVGDESIVLGNAASVFFGNNIVLSDADDSIFDMSDASYSTIFGGNGNDIIAKNGEHVSILGGNGNDTLRSAGLLRYSTIDGGDGDDLIAGGRGDLVKGGNGNDRFNVYSKDMTVVGGNGDDLIRIDTYGSARIVYNNGDGNDTVIGFTTNSTLDFDYDSREQTGNDVLFRVGDGSVLLQNFHVENFLPGEFGTAADDSINNTVDSIHINGRAGNDRISNGGRIRRSRAVRVMTPSTI